MYDLKTNTVTFPLIIPGTVLGEVEHTYNSINGGFVGIADLGLVRNKFWGGKTDRLGLIKEYGFYAAKHYQFNEIIGFYIHDPDKITELGKKLIQEKYPNATISYVKESIPAHSAPTPEAIQRKKTLIEEAIQNGAEIGEVTNANVEELDGLIRAQKSGKTKNRPMVENAPTLVDDSPIFVEFVGK